MIDFSNGITPICVNVPLSGGAATCSFNYVIGSYTIVAAYRGSAGFIQSSGQTTQVVQKASTTSVVTAPTMVTGQAGLYQASVTINDPGSASLANPTGTVSFYAQDSQDNPQVALCSTPVGLSGATVSCSSSAAIPSGNSWSVTAVYSGDTNFTGSTSTPVSQIVSEASTTTEVSAVASGSPVTGQSITATAGDAITAPGSDSAVAPTGTVEFETSLDGGPYTGVPGCLTQPAPWSTPADAGTSTCTLAAPPAVSSVEFEAVYSGDTNFAPSTSPPFSLVVGEASTTSTIGVDTDPSVSGETVNYTATVVATPPGSDSTPPTGTVEFEYSTDSGDFWSPISVCESQDLTWDSGTSSGTSTCATAFAAASSGALVQGVYSGDSNFDGSASTTPVSQTVSQAQTTTTVGLVPPGPTGTVSGQTVTATATLVITAPGSDSPRVPTGTVDFQSSSNGGAFSNIPGCSTQTLTWDPVGHTGTSTCATEFAAGAIDVQAVYSGDTNFSLATSPSASETVSPAATTTSVIATPDASVSGQTIELNASVLVTSPGSGSPVGPSGSVDFESSTGGDIWNGIPGCTAQTLTWDSTDDTGSALCSLALAASSSGLHVEAVYLGDTNYTASTSPEATQTVTSAATDTGLTGIVNPTVTGQVITANAGFTINAPGSDSPTAPTGDVEFEISLSADGPFSPIPDCTDQPVTWDAATSAGSATCTLAAPPAVSHVQLEGIYSGDANFAGSISPPFALIINEALTSTVVSVNNNPSVSGQNVTYTGTVAVTPPGTDSTPPTGSVDFESGGGTWPSIVGCTTETLIWSSEAGTGTATCTTAFSAASTGVAVRAVYSGDENFDGSISVPLAQVVSAAQTSTSVVLSLPNSVSGQGFTANATVSITDPGSDGPSIPTGTVDFQSSTDGTWSGISGCESQSFVWSLINDTGTASCAPKFDAASSPVQIRAVYSGDLNFGLSTSTSETETVDKVSTTTTMSATPDASVSGQSVDLGASVLISSPGSDNPAGASGPVDFEYSTNSGDTWNAINGCATQDVSWDSTTHIGSAACTAAFMGQASDVEVRAVYSGDLNFTGSGSLVAAQAVSAASTATRITTSANPSVNGQTVTVGAVVSVISPGGDIAGGPTGTVLFESSTDGGSIWQPVGACLAQSLVWSDSLDNGTAGCNVQFAVSQSGIQYKAVYSGSSGFTTSVSDSFTQRVEKALTTTAVTSAPDSSGPLQPVTFVAKVSVVLPGRAVETGSVRFLDGGSAICAGVALDASGSASCSSHLPITATQSVVAVYSGNSLLTGSSGSMVQNVRHGYWLMGADGGVFSYGDAQFYGSLPQIGYSPAGSGLPHQLNAPLVGITSTLSGDGYWLVASDGGVFSFGDAVFHGSTGGMRLNAPIVAMAMTPDGNGYWLVASDGGVFAYGGAGFYGSTGGMHLNKPIVAMAIAPGGKGYWLVASDGGVFAFGTARYHGSPSTGSIPSPVVGIAATGNGGGYWMAASSGHVYSYGNASPAADAPTSSPVVGITGTADGGGYWMASASGGIFTHGDALFDGSASNLVLQRPIVGLSGI